MLAEEAARSAAVASRLPELVAEIATLREEMAIQQGALALQRRDLARLEEAAAESERGAARATRERDDARHALLAAELAAQQSLRDAGRQAGVLAESEKRASAARAALVQAEKSLARLARERDDIQAALRAARIAAETVTAELERQKAAAAALEHRAAAAQAALAQAEELNGRLIRESDELRQSFRAAETASGLLAQELERQKTSAAEFARRDAAARAALAQAQEGIAALERELAAGRQHAEEHQAQIHALSAQLLEAAERHRADSAAFEDRMAAAQSALKAAAGEAETLRGQLGNSEQNVQAALRALAEQTDLAGVRSSRIAELEAASRTLRRDLIASVSQVKRLEANVKNDAVQIADLQASGARAAGEAAVLRQTVAALQDRERSQQALIAQLRDEARRHRNALIEATRQAAGTRNSFAFRFGMALIEGFSSVSGLARLPGRLFALARAGIVRKRAKGTPYSGESDAMPVDTVPLVKALQVGGLARARALIERTGGDAAHMSAQLSELSRLAEPLDMREAVALAREAHDLDPRPFRAKRLAFLLADIGSVDEASALLNGLPVEDILRLKPSEKTRRERLLGLARLRAGTLTIPPRAAPAFTPQAKRIVYVAASALPFHVSGYTRRTHALVKETRRRGWDVLLLTRPGYPRDRTDRLAEGFAAQLDLEGVEPVVLEGSSLSRSAYDTWVDEAADLIEKRARASRPSLIHAASNWQSALPALIAARRLGLPFVYEVRGFWDLTRTVRSPVWAGSEEHALFRAMEAAIVRAADRVVTLSPRLADECVRLGAERARVVVVSNASDMDFVPPARAAEARAALGYDPEGFVVGYCGSIVEYEGVDDLVRAIAVLVEKGVDARAIIAGDGKAREMAVRLAEQLGLSARISFPGAVTPEVSARVLAAADVVALPRRSFSVTELVEPFKPIEAMAVGRPLVASNVAPHADVIRDGETGLLHRAEDHADLADKLLLLARDDRLRADLVGKARKFVDEARRWPIVVPALTAAWEAACVAPLAAAGAIRPSDYLLLAQPNPQLVVAEAEAIVGGLEARARAFNPEQRRRFSALADAAIKSGGVEAARDLVRRQSEGHPPAFHARCLVLTAAALRRAEFHAEELALLEQAVAVVGEPATWRPLARAQWYRGELAPAQALLARLRKAEGATPSAETERLAVAVEQRRILMEDRDGLLARHAAPRGPALSPIANKSVYFLHFTLPYASNGYATRSHGLLKGLREAGMETVAYSRAGFPADMPNFKDGTPIPSEDVIDGIVYRRVLSGSRTEDAELDYILNSADSYEAILRKERPAIVHAASNYTTGLPALIAARRVGLPFVYEVRGFWELTRASRQADFEQNPQFALMETLEALVAREADRVLTLTSAMRDQFVAKGIDARRIGIVPNGVDTAHFHMLPRDEALAQRLGLPAGVPVIGYVGSIVGYEGLDDLVDAASSLRDAGRDFRLLLVGDGAALPGLRERIAASRLAHRVIVPGRVPHDEVAAYYSLIDICPFPRKPIPLCEMVSPLKPFEAMAMEKTVLVSSVRALTDIVADGRNGLVFRKGDVGDLAKVLDRLIGDTSLRAQLARQGRRWVESSGTWNRSAETIAALYRELIKAEKPRQTDAAVIG